MTERVGVRRAAALGALLMGTTALAGMVAPAPAQAQTTAAATRSFNIPAQSLREALLIFGQQSGLQVTAQGPLVEGRTSSAVSGDLPPAEALSRLLTGTGLTFRFDGNDAVRLEPVPQTADGAVQLGPVRVEGEGGGTSIGYTGSVHGTALTENTGSYTTPGPVAAATGLNLTLRETPQSVTVVTRQRMDDQGLQSSGQVLEQVTGVSTSYRGGAEIGGSRPIYARGYLVNNYQVDGVRTPSTVWGNSEGWNGNSSMDMAIYDSVTVVRGATGLLNGAGDPSGSFNFTRKRPTDQFQASLSASIGRWDQYRGVADVGGPLNTAGSLRARLVMAHEEGDSWIDRYHGKKTVAYGVLDADLGDKTLLSLAVEHSRQRANGCFSFCGFRVVFADDTPTPFKRGDNSSSDWTYWRSQHTSVSVALEHRFSDDWQATGTYIRHWTKVDTENADATNADILPDGISTPEIAKFKFEQPADVFEARLNGRYTLWGRQHDLVIGLNAAFADGKYPVYIAGQSNTTVNVLDWNGSLPEPDWTALSNGPRASRTRQVGAYLVTRLRPTDELTIIAGTRWSNWASRNLNNRLVTDDREEKGIFTPYVGVVYDLTKQLSVYASYTTIFNPQGDKDVNGRILDPERGKNIELGLKGEWLEGRLNASAAVFWSGKDNLAVEDGDNLTPDGDQAYIAVDDTKARGWEVDVSGELAPGWHVQGGYTRVALKDSSGNRLNTAYQPKHSLKFFTTWTPPVLPRLTVGGGVIWQSEIHRAPEPIYTQDSYAVVNLTANYAFNDHLKLSVQLNNVFDKTYRTHTLYWLYGAPRNLYGTLRYQF